MQEDYEHVKPAMQKQEICALVVFDILLEVYCIEMQLRRQVLVDERQSILK